MAPDADEKTGVLSPFVAPVFPPELFDSVIDHLHDDKATLRECSLVCKDWVPSSTFHLFFTFSWPPCHHMWHVRILRKARGNLCLCSQDKAGFDRCLTLLSESPRIAAAIQCLKLNSSRSVHHIDGSTRFTDEAIPRSTLLAILDCLRHLRTVEFNNCLLEREMINVRNIYGAREVHEVRIIPRHDHGYVPLYRALEVLSVFSHLRKLSIDGQDCRPLLVGSPPLARRTHVAALKVICKDADSTESIMSTLLQRTDLASLRSLTLCSLLGDRPQESSFLGAVPSTLEALEYHVVGTTPEIHRFSHLHSLTLVGSLYIEQGGRSDWPDIMRDLGAIAGPHMRDFGITLQVYEDPFWTFWLSGATLGDMPFHHLTNSLKGQDWVLFSTYLRECWSLQSLRFKIELMPMLDGQGMLSRDISRCVHIVWELVDQCLPASVAEVTRVEVIRLGAKL